MEDYPRDLTEFEERFATEEACRQYLFCLRWPSGQVDKVTAMAADRFVTLVEGRGVVSAQRAG